MVSFVVGSCLFCVCPLCAPWAGWSCLVVVVCGVCRGVRSCLRVRCVRGCARVGVLVLVVPVLLLLLSSAARFVVRAGLVVSVAVAWEISLQLFMSKVFIRYVREQLDLS